MQEDAGLHEGGKSQKRDHGSQPVLLSSFYCTGIISATCIAWLGFLKKVLDEIFCAVIYCIYELQDVKTCQSVIRYGTEPQVTVYQQIAKQS